MNNSDDAESRLPAQWSAPEHYSSARLWPTLLRAAKTASSKGLEAALTLFYCLMDRDTPTWARSVIIGALGYLILPADLLPDLLPALGFTDDWSALLAAIGVVYKHVKPAHRDKARDQVSRLLSEPSAPPPEEMAESFLASERQTDRSH